MPPPPQIAAPTAASTTLSRPESMSMPMAFITESLTPTPAFTRVLPSVMRSAGTPQRSHSAESSPSSTAVSFCSHCVMGSCTASRISSPEMAC